MQWVLEALVFLDQYEQTIVDAGIVKVGKEVATIRFYFTQ